MVADAEAAHAWTHCLHDPGRLVSAAERQVADGDVAGGEVIVGVAQARRDDPHEHLVGARWVKVDGVDLPGAGHLRSSAARVCIVVSSW